MSQQAVKTSALILAGVVFLILLAVVGPTQIKVFRRKASIQESFLHGFRSRSDAANGVGAIDLDELLKDIVRKLPGGRINLGLGGG